MENVRVLVTGAGSGVGQGIHKALRISNLPVTIVGADIAPMNSALFRADEVVQIPRVESPGALDQMISAIQRAKVRVVMIGSEFDLEFFSNHRPAIERATGAHVIVSKPEVVKISNDKWLTAEFLRQHGISHPKSYCPEDLEDAITVARSWGYPFVLKTRSGTSSRHVHVINDEPTLSRLYESVPKPLLQEMIARPSSELGSEFTCSVFKTRDGRILGPFVARRTLRGGSSWTIEVCDVPEIHPLMLDIGRNLDFSASLNVQLMIGPKGPMPFEFNARFSGTTAVRAHFGFNEPMMALRDLLGLEIAPPAIRRGIAMRYLEEVFVEEASVLDVQFDNFPKGQVRPWF